MSDRPNDTTRASAPQTVAPRGTAHERTHPGIAASGEAVESHAGASGAPPAQQVDLRIDELVLEGFSRHDRARIAESLEAELGRLIAERVASGGFRGDLKIRSIDGGAFSVGHGMRPERVGVEIARAIMRSME